MNTFLILFLSFFSFVAVANVHMATIVKLENTSEVYVPGENNEGGFKHVKYLGSVYHIVPAAKGFKLANGYILSTGPKSKAKVIFKNGDHLFVAENTQYKIAWKIEPAGQEKDASILNLVRGAVRGMIQKDGPRSGMKVETPSAVMGIRGTDFYVSEKREALTVSVMRGEVKLWNDKNIDKSVTVQTGQTLNSEEKIAKINAMTKEDLQLITKGSTIVETKPEVQPEATKEISELETSAKQVTLNDIKEYQPQLYKEILEKQSPKEMSSDSLAINTTKIMEEKAPNKFKKPTDKELEDDSDPYESYKFKKK